MAKPRYRPVATTAGSGLLVLILLFASASGGAVERRAMGSNRTTIGCATSDWSRSVPKAKPRKCRIFVDNVPAHAYLFELRGLHWKHWGASKARARGDYYYCCMGGSQRFPVTVKASRRLEASCGHWAYGKVKVHFRNGHGRDQTLRPPACPRGLSV